MTPESMATRTYGAEDFIQSFQADAASAAERAVIADEAAKYDFSYRRLTQGERDTVILGILGKLDTFTQVGAHRHAIWESCWSDAKAAFATAKGELAALYPVFMGAHPIVRLDGDFAKPNDPKFETHWFRVMRRWLFTRHLAGAEKIYEFGCGSGFNLATAAQMFPKAELMGLDWSPSAVELVDQIGKTNGFNLTGRRFDFFDPDSTISIDSGTVAMTFAALEQTGERFVTFADWLLAKRPKLVLSMEPLLDLYDPASLVDDLAIRYHTRRQYLSGYYAWAKAQAAADKIEIVHSFRPKFGSLYHEAYGVLVWRPI